MNFSVHETLATFRKSPCDAALRRLNPVSASCQCGTAKIEPLSSFARYRWPLRLPEPLSGLAQRLVASQADISQHAIIKFGEGVALVTSIDPDCGALQETSDQTVLVLRRLRVGRFSLAHASPFATGFVLEESRTLRVTDRYPGRDFGYHLR
jgi:hypothetical protein